MKRKYADYEYRINGHILRVASNEIKEWGWLIIWSNGEQTSSYEIGEGYRLKRQARQGGLDHINNQTKYNTTQIQYTI